MKILHLTSHLNIGGVPRYVLSLSKGLRARGHRVIIASGGGQLEVDAQAAGLTHWRVPLHTSSELNPTVRWASRRLGARLRHEPVDVIHAHTRVAQVVADRLSRSLTIPYVTTWHGLFRRRLGRRLWPCTGAKTIAISEAVRQHLLRDFRVPDERIRLILNGIDVDHFAAVPDAATIREYRLRWHISDHGPVIGEIGRLASGGVKGFDLLLEAVRLLKPTMPQLQVLIVGDGPRRQKLEALAERLGLREQVHFLGSVSDVRIPLALMDVFLFTSRWEEGFGLSLVEAMAAGKPIVAARVGTTPTLIEHGHSGWLVSPRLAPTFAEGLGKLLNDPTLAAQLGGAAQRRARERFSLDRMIDEVEAVYREVVDHSAAHPSR